MGFCIVCKKNSIFATRKFAAGALAQSVEQRTENPCVPGSIPGGTTILKALRIGLFLFYFIPGFKLILRLQKQNALH